MFTKSIRLGEYDDETLIIDMIIILIRSEYTLFDQFIQRRYGDIV